MNLEIRNKTEVDKEFIELGREMLATIKVIGIREPISDQEMVYYCKYVIQYFPWLKLGELRKAFELASSGVLDLDNVGHFQSFDINYIGKVLKAFKSYRNKMNTPMYQGIERSKEPIKELPRGNDGAVWWDLCQEFIREGTEPYGPLEFAYWYGINENLLNISAAERQAFLNKTRERLTREAKEHRTIAGKTAAMILKDKNMLGAHCAREYMKQYIKKNQANPSQK